MKKFKDAKKPGEKKKKAIKIVIKCVPISAQLQPVQISRCRASLISVQLLFYSSSPVHTCMGEDGSNMLKTKLVSLLEELCSKYLM